MPRSLKLLLVGVVAGSAIALVAATLVIWRLRRHCAAPAASRSAMPRSTTSFWDRVLDRGTLVSSALPVQMPRGTRQAVSFAPILASRFLGGPAVGGWVAAIGTTEMREIRGRDPVVRNARKPRSVVHPCPWGWACVVRAVLIPGRSPHLVLDLRAALVAGVVYFGLNVLIRPRLSPAHRRSILVVVVDGWRSSAVSDEPRACSAWRGSWHRFSS